MASKEYKYLIQKPDLENDESSNKESVSEYGVLSNRFGEDLIEFGILRLTDLAPLHNVRHREYQTLVKQGLKEDSISSSNLNYD